MDVIRQTKACIFSASMGNRPVKLGYWSKNQKNAVSLQHHRKIQLKSPSLLMKQKKMTTIYKMRPVLKVFVMLGSHCVCLCSRLFWPLSLYADEEKIQVKMTNQHPNLSMQIVQMYRATKCHNLSSICNTRSNVKCTGGKIKYNAGKNMDSISNEFPHKNSIDIYYEKLSIYLCKAAVKTRNVNKHKLSSSCILCTVRESLDDNLISYFKSENRLLERVWVIPITNLWHHSCMFDCCGLILHYMCSIRQFCLEIYICLVVANSIILYNHNFTPHCLITCIMYCLFFFKFDATNVKDNISLNKCLPNV